MKFLKLQDNDYFWVAIKLPKKPAELVLTTYQEDAPSWDIVPVLDRTLRVANQSTRKRDLPVIYFDLFDLLAIFRDLLDDPINVDATKKMKNLGVKKWTFDTETEFVAYLLKKQPEVLYHFERL